MNKLQGITIVVLVFGGFLYTGITNEIRGLAFMCMGIWFLQLLHEVE